MNKKRGVRKHLPKVYCIVFAAALILSGCRAADSAKQTSSGASLWDCLGIRLEELSKVSFTMGEDTVTVSPREAEAFLSVLSSATLDHYEAYSEEKEAFTPSGCRIVLQTEQETLEPVFYWFSGFYTENTTVEDNKPYQSFTYTDDRFDVVLRGQRYVFRYNTDKGFWTEDQMQQLYDDLAKAHGFARATEQVSAQSVEYLSDRYFPKRSAEEVLEEASAVVLAHVEQKTLTDIGYGGVYLTGIWFEVEESYDGTLQPGDRFLICPAGGKSMKCSYPSNNEYFDAVRWRLPHREQPIFEEGVSYLLCLTEAGDDTRWDVSGNGAAKLIDESFYPLFNTEHHPFYAMTPEQLKEKIEVKEEKMSEALKDEMPGDLWKSLGIRREAIVNVVFTYEGQSISVSPERVSGWLDTLSTGTLTKQDTAKEPDPYHPSEYQVRFDTSKGEIEPIFYWFSGKIEQQEIVGERYNDRRFDVVLDGVRYEFSYDIEKGAFTEEQMRKEYDRLAESLGEKRAFELQGADREERSPSLDPTIDRALLDIPSTEKALSDADEVVLARMVEEVNCVTFEQSGVVARFEVMEDYRGELAPGDVFFLIQSDYLITEFDEAADDYQIIWHRASVRCPAYEIGEEYLLLLEKDLVIYQYEQEETKLRYQCHEPIGAARLVDGVFYPLYNTEHHPLLGLTTEDLSK